MASNKRKFSGQTPQKKNDYKSQRREIAQNYFDVGEEMGVQKMADYLAIALHSPECMKKNVYSRERIDEFFAYLQTVVDFYAKAFGDSNEADYIQQKLDDALKEIYKDDFQPFYERYPYLKDESYKKAKKGWVQ